jgi:hypothetical protein
VGFFIAFNSLATPQIRRLTLLFDCLGRAERPDLNPAHWG